MSTKHARLSSSYPAISASILMLVAAIAFGCSGLEGCPDGQEPLNGICVSVCPLDTVRGVDGTCTSGIGDTDGDTFDCEPTNLCANLTCNEGDVWCIDNCGQLVEMEEDCVRDDCDGGECQAPDLMWQNGCGSYAGDYTGAVSYCDELEADGFDDWRLPSISELRLLISGCEETEYDGICPATEKGCAASTCFSEDKCGGCSTEASTRFWVDEMASCEHNRRWGYYYWSSTKITNEDYTKIPGAWMVDFVFGAVTWSQLTSDGRARCVRVRLPDEIDATDGDVEDGDVEDGDIEDGDIDDGDIEDGDIEDGDIEDGMVGSACEHNEECLTAFCITSSVWQTLTGEEDLEIPGGYCSTLNPNDCTEDVGGIPVSLAFLGTEYMDFSMCFASCEDNADCRTQDNVICWDTSTLILSGYMTENEVSAIFGDNNICIPRDLRDSSLEYLSGGDVGDGDTSDGDIGNCSEGKKRCNENVVEECGELGDWRFIAECSQDELCIYDECVNEADVEECGGNCGSINSYCIGNDLCACVMGTMALYPCDEFCSQLGKTSRGCGLEEDDFYFCICE